MPNWNIDKICRLCCENKGRLYPLFEQRQKRSLPDIIMDMSRLQIEPNDGMPQNICRVCSTTILRMYETIEAYRANDLKLRQQLIIVPLIEIKEEEVEYELLEKICQQEIKIDEIGMKQEVMEEEYLESEPSFDELNSSERKANIEGPEKMNSKNEDDSPPEDGDTEWKPTDQDNDKDEEPLIKAKRRYVRKQENPGESPKKRYVRRRRNPNEPKKKPGRKRLRPLDPNRPRKHDFKCYICKSDSHGTAEALMVHLNSAHLDILPYTCSECVTETIVIKTVQKLNLHLRQHLNPEKCPFCDKRYTTANNVATHIEMFHAEDASQTSWKCKHCEEVFTSKSSLTHHMKLHTTAASCELCGKVFKERSKLRIHIQRRHEKIKKYECHICHKKLVSLDSVQNHIKTYHSNQVYKCRFCQKTYNSELSHRYHEKKHEENPDYVAARDWSEYYTVVEGQENTVGVKLKKCNLCGITATAMGFHLSTVHFPTEYRCEICSATFKRKQYYETHVLEHTHGKAEKCPICNREYSDRKALIAHLRTKKHQGHPLAESLHWLGYKGPRKMSNKTLKTEDAAETKDQVKMDLDVGTDDDDMPLNLL
ncbi:zinc finger protein 227-like [Armigeres subalbatus]|uniref:zinc finger protein 227-like n=1 Tax=Armigeres subalbatus TaxID=124917 RepID=UPI002ED3339E